ncbi:hypothetical protein, partial [Sphingobium fuliginis]|uniref:hypothetical protein n=1 Tax=Sphingobium fuliginis (strain ATCC 27551) TaxID=336203 RepID=UPI001C3007A4
FMPDTMGALLDQLGVGEGERTLSTLKALPEGTVLPPPRRCSQDRGRGVSETITDSHCHLDYFGGGRRSRRWSAAPARQAWDA